MNHEDSILDEQKMIEDAMPTISEVVEPPLS